MKKKFIILTSILFVLSSCSFLSKNTTSEQTSSEFSSNQVTTSEQESSSSENISSSTSSNQSINSNSSNSSNDSDNSSSESSSSSEENKENNENKEFYNLIEPSFDVPKRLTKEEFIFDDLFNLGNSVSIKMEMSDKELNELEADYKTGYKSEIYHVCDKVTISITNYGNEFTWEFQNVGIRQKGNTSRQDIFLGEDINPYNHFKLSFDETFDDPEMYSSSFIQEMKEKMGSEDYSKREFLGLSGIDFKWNKNNDSTHIKEVYASKLYQAGGILSQHIGLSDISMIRVDKDNKVTSFGLCTIYEPGSKSIIKRSLSNDNYYVNMPTWKQEKKGTFGIDGVNYGDFYKCSYGTGEGNSSSGADMSNDSISGKRVGIGNISGSYIPAYERKTNTDVEYEDTQLKNIIKTINNGSYVDIEKVVDLQYLAKEQALSYLVGNPDDMRINYNNYLLYIRRTDGKLVVVPYDLDRCFGITKDFNVMNGMTELDPLSSNTFQGKQRNNLLLKTILSSSNNECKKDYLNILEVIKNSSWVKNETFNAFYNQAKSSYPSYLFNESNENMSFDNYISKKIDRINGSSSSIEDDKKVYDNLFVVGNFNSWGNYPESDLSKYKMEYLGNYEYKVIINIDSSFTGNELKFKFNNGFADYSQIDWFIDSSLASLNKNGGGQSTSLSNIKNGDIITIKINTNTLEASVKIESITSGGEVEPDNEYNIYIVGNFNSWGEYSSSDLPKYKFEYLGEDTYQVTIVVNNDLPDDILQFKINSGKNNYDIDWTLNSDLTKLVMSKGENAKLSGVFNGDTIQITINTSTLEAEVKKI
ncbi:MAG: hypothetical protein SOW55_04550 [Bacilli bacterium]|nr:hypothetical protein [Bacilli bacterium]